MASHYSEDQYLADEILLKKIYLYAGYLEEHLPSLIVAVRQGDLAMESMVENAISKVGKLRRVNMIGMDFEDGSDAKKTTVVNQGTVKKPSRGAGFSTKNKKGVLRVVAIDSMVNEVFYFKIPPSFYLNTIQKRREIALRIYFDKNGGKPNMSPNKTTTKEIWSFQVNTFEELCS